MTACTRFVRGGVTSPRLPASFSKTSAIRIGNPSDLLHLLDDETEPAVIEIDSPRRVVWSSLWAKRPDAQIHFDLQPARGGTDLRWTLYADEPLPGAMLARRMRKRMDVLINANLRFTYGQ